MHGEKAQSPTCTGVWQMEGSETDLNSNIHRDKHESVGCLGTTCRKKIKFDLLDIQSVRFLRTCRQIHPLGNCIHKGGAQNNLEWKWESVSCQTVTAAEDRWMLCDCL